MAAPVTGDVVERTVPARAGLVGNPSDGYGGAVLATVVPGLAATVQAVPAGRVSFASTGVGVDVVESWPSLDAWAAHTVESGHGEEHRIISAAIWTLVEHLRSREGVCGVGIELRWATSVPRSVGLAGSSALAVAAIDATAVAWGVHLDRRIIAALALHAERDVLGIAAGWQDRIVQSFGRTVLVDAARMERVDGVEVPYVATPVAPAGAETELLVAWRVAAGRPSDDYHAPLRRSAAVLVEPMARLATLGRRAAQAWVRGDVVDLAAAMDLGWSTRQACAPLDEEDAALVELVRAAGLAATTPGSGGAVVAVCTDDGAVSRAIEQLHRAGCRVIRFAPR